MFLIAHHAQFDGLILNAVYNVRPKMWGCTLSMGRLLHGAHISVGLDSLRQRYGLAPKTTPYDDFIGKKWSELDAATQNRIAEGCCDEVESIWRLFCKMSKEFPLEEYGVVDETIRMFTEPVLRADVKLLGELWVEEDARKRALCAALDLDNDARLQSMEQFKALLEAEGVEVSYKNGKNAPIPAFAKNDEFMIELREHPSERVRALVEARLGCKSTLLQTRAETLGFMASRGALPVYLRYAGAGTLRPSGGDGANWLNFRRGSALRRAVVAPPGYLLCPVDSSQIEFRVCLYLAGEMDILNKMAAGGDPYSDIASLFYGRKIYKPSQGDPQKLLLEQMRGCGKQACLMCQYGAGAKRFRATAKAGLYGPPVDLTEQDAQHHVDIYRKTYEKVVHYWHEADHILSVLACGDKTTWGPLVVKNSRIYLPNGCPLIYDTLQWHHPDGERGYWRLRVRRNQWKKMFGARLVQNICEAVSRVIVTQAMLRMKAMGIRTLNHPYDELLLLIPDDGNAASTVEKCLAEMRKTPDWLPGLPLDAEAHLNERYAK